MKLAILTQYFYPETGAPQNRLYELSKIFREFGWETEVFTSMPNYPKGKIFPGYRWKLFKKDNTDGINISRFWIFASNSSKKIPRIVSMISFSVTSLLGYFRLRKFKPDFIFTESPPLTLAFSGYLLSRMTGAKLIMNVSDIWPLSAKELGAVSEGGFYDKLESFEKFLYGNSFLCTGQSEEIINHIKLSGDFNTYLFRNGVDINRFSKPVSGHYQGSKVKIVYAGLLGVAQGILDIIRNISFDELNAELHIYGEGSEKNAVKEFVSSNPERGVILHNSVSSSEIPEILRQYHLALIPLVKNIYGAVPSKIYEAMAAGLPVLFSGSGEGARIINGNKAGLVSPPKDFKKLAENILSLSKSNELRNEMSANGRRAAEEKYDRNILIKNFSDKLISCADIKENLI
ncbi:MAG: glycosyltransferase family 4 protein [Bacteroidetes bacterium]|nr:glycosyltransferase family 4 protein [Bacteroidota bacterium]